MANVQGIGEAAGAQAPAFPEKFVDPSSQEAQAAAGKLTAAYPNDPVSAPYFVSAPSQPQVISGVPPGTTYYPPSTAYDAYRGYVDRVTPGGVHEMPYRNPARYMGGDPREGRMGMPQVLSRAALSSPFQTKAGGAFREAEMARGAREKGGLNADEGFVELDRSGRPLLPQRRPSFSANRTFRLRAETVKKPAVAVPLCKSKGAIPATAWEPFAVPHPAAVRSLHVPPQQQRAVGVDVFEDPLASDGARPPHVGTCPMRPSLQEPHTFCLPEGYRKPYRLYADSRYCITQSAARQEFLTVMRKGW